MSDSAQTAVQEEVSAGGIDSGDRARPQAAEAGVSDEAAIERGVEAALLVSDRAVGAVRLAEAVGCDEKEVPGAIDRLNAGYAQTGRAFRVEAVAGGYRLMTVSEVADVVERMHRKRSDHRLSVSQIETLSIVAYKQPVLRADVEAIRGAGCGEVLRQLMDRRLVKVVGRAEELGRPLLYGTTPTFLEVFGLKSVTELPSVEALREAMG
ncbi:MAG: SMC-Scp complex subunit ScpB [Planctomycetota bacterium]